MIMRLNMKLKEEGTT